MRPLWIEDDVTERNPTDTHRDTPTPGGSARNGNAQNADAPAEQIRIVTRGAAATVTLDRPRALNAITVGMRAQLVDALPGFARDPMIYCVVMRSEHPRAFSAGGDVRELTAWSKTDAERARRAFADEYRLNWALDCFTKPTVSLIDGIVMGSGVGMTLYGTHRVAGEGYRFAMPETAIGLFPDVGVAYTFARMPDAIGLYLGLTGRQIGRGDAFHLGLATHCIAAAEFPAIEEALSRAEPVDQVLDARHVDPSPGETLARREVIRRCFSADSVSGIMQRLEAEQGAERDWTAAVRDELLTRSPTSLALTFRHIRSAASRDLRATLEIDYRLACRCLDAHDFAEGVRAMLVDKNGAPRWQPAEIPAVTNAMIDAYFAPLDAGGLNLPTRAEMQSMR